MFESSAVGKGEARAVLENWAGLWRSINLTLIERMPTLYLGACGLATAHG